MSIWHTPEREQLRKTVRAFAEREVLPNIDEWEQSGMLPRELHRKAGDAGLLGAGLPRRSAVAAATVPMRWSSARRCTTPERRAACSRRCSPAVSQCRT